MTPSPIDRVLAAPGLCAAVMRAVLAGVLALGLLVGASPAAAAPAAREGSDEALEQEMQRLFALRTVDAPAFVTRTRELEAAPPPLRLGQRQFLRFLSANRAAFEGRFAEAITLAEPLAGSAEDPKLGLAAGTFVINMRAGTREFEAGLRELDRLLKANTKAEGPLRDEVRGLWAVAAIFYAELEKPELSAWYAKRLAEDSPSPRQACTASHFVVRARQASGDPGLSSDDFDRVDQTCRAADEDAVMLGFSALSFVRFLRERDRPAEALGLLEERVGRIESTRYPRLMAEAYALDAELLLAAG
ncbi:hypothetical protein, partial [Silanimonas sp.]|uniref:hypothetical protein n=1 Tax=Silanimonas sp. TaxID=1929290 RepID=UPI0022C04434